MADTKSQVLELCDEIETGAQLYRCFGAVKAHGGAGDDNFLKKFLPYWLWQANEGKFYAQPELVADDATIEEKKFQYKLTDSPEVLKTVVKNAQRTNLMGIIDTLTTTRNVMNFKTGVEAKDLIDVDDWNEPCEGSTIPSVTYLDFNGEKIGTYKHQCGNELPALDVPLRGGANISGKPSGFTKDTWMPVSGFEGLYYWRTVIKLGSIEEENEIKTYHTDSGLGEPNIDGTEYNKDRRVVLDGMQGTLWFHNRGENNVPVSMWARKNGYKGAVFVKGVQEQNKDVWYGAEGKNVRPSDKDNIIIKGSNGDTKATFTYEYGSPSTTPTGTSLTITFAAHSVEEYIGGGLANTILKYTYKCTGCDDATDREFYNGATYTVKAKTPDEELYEKENKNGVIGLAPWYDPNMRGEITLPHADTLSAGTYEFELKFAEGETVPFRVVVTKKEITPGTVTVSKVYDGTTTIKSEDVTVAAPTVGWGVKDGDEALWVWGSGYTVTKGSAVFKSKDTSESVIDHGETATLTLGEELSKNYKLADNYAFKLETGKIIAKTLTIKSVSVEKVYDGNVSIADSNFKVEFDGWIEGEEPAGYNYYSVTQTGLSFAAPAPNAGNGINITKQNSATVSVSFVESDNDGYDEMTANYEIKTEPTLLSMLTKGTINKRNLSEATVTFKTSAPEPPYTYDGSTKEPKLSDLEIKFDDNFTLTTLLESDFEVEAKDNIYAGEETAKVWIKAKNDGNYTGETQKTAFTIGKAVVTAKLLDGLPTGAPLVGDPSLSPLNLEISGGTVGVLSVHAYWREITSSNSDYIDNGEATIIEYGDANGDKYYGAMISITAKDANYTFGNTEKQKELAGMFAPASKTNATSPAIDVKDYPKVVDKDGHEVLTFFVVYKKEREAYTITFNSNGGEFVGPGNLTQRTFITSVIDGRLNLALLSIELKSRICGKPIVWFTAPEGGDKVELETKEFIRNEALWAQWDWSAEKPNISNDLSTTEMTYTLNDVARELTVTASKTDASCGDLTFQWYRKTADETDYTAISGETTASYTPQTTTMGTFYYYVIVTNTVTNVGGTMTNTATSNVATITVMVNAVPPVINVHPSDATYKKDSTATALTVTATAPDDGALSYQWYSNTANSNTGGTLIDGATSANYTPLTTTVGTTYYYVEVTNTRDVNGNKTATTTSGAAKIEVVPIVNAQTPVISTHPIGTTYNQGATATPLTVAASVTDGGTLSYQWYSNATNSNTDGTPISGATANSYTPPTTGSGTTYYYVVVTNTNNDVNGETTASATSNVAAITIEIKPVVAVVPTQSKPLSDGKVDSTTYAVTLTNWSSPSAAYVSVAPNVGNAVSWRLDQIVWKISQNGNYYDATAVLTATTTASVGVINRADLKLTVKDGNNNVTSDAFALSVVKSSPITVADTLLKFRPVVDGYKVQPAEQGVSITAKSKVKLTFTVPDIGGPGGDYEIRLSTSSAPLLQGAGVDVNASSTTLFYIRPRRGLDVGVYDGEIKVYADGVEYATVKVRFEVLPGEDYRLNVFPDELSFGSLPSPYRQPAAQTVEIVNTGTQPITGLKVSSIYYEWRLSRTDLGGNGATATLTIRPNPYSEDVVPGDMIDDIIIESNEAPSVTVRAMFTVENLMNDYKIIASQLNTFGTSVYKVDGKYDRPPLQVVTVANVSTVGVNPISVTLPKSTSKYEIKDYAQSPKTWSAGAVVLASGEEAKFTVQPQATGLSAGNNDEMIQIKGTIGTSGTAVFDTLFATFTLTPSRTISANPMEIDFGEAIEGYPMIKDTVITIDNTCAETVTPLSVALPTNFSPIAKPLSKTSLARDSSATFAIRPKLGLTAGKAGGDSVYVDTIKVTGNGGASAFVVVTFKVTAKQDVTPPETPNQVGKLITFNANGGTVTPTSRWTNENGTLTRADGTSLLPTPSRESGCFNFINWVRKDGSEVTEYTVFAANDTIYAEWEALTPCRKVVTFSSGANGDVSATWNGDAIPSGYEVPSGSDVVFTADPIDGYKVVRWTVNNSVISDTSTVYTVRGLSKETNVVVTFDRSLGVASPDRVVPGVVKADEAAALPAPAAARSGLTVGPVPAVRSAGSVSFYRDGGRLEYSVLFVYDASGSLVRKIPLIDGAVGGQRQRKVAVWNLRDGSGRLVSEGTYLVRGVLKPRNGKPEKAELLVGVK